MKSGDFRGGFQGGSTRGSFNRPESTRGSFNRPDSTRGSFNRPDSTRGSFSRPDSTRGSFNRPDSTRGSFNRPDSTRGNFSRQDSTQDLEPVVKSTSSQGEFQGGSAREEFITIRRGLFGGSGIPPELGGEEEKPRPPPSTYIPEKREVDDIYKEDLDNAENYRGIADNDENITVSGQNCEHVCMLDSWKDAGFEEKLYENIVERSKYICPRKIQAHVIPLVMEGRDVKGHAETGSGKTAAFLLPIINALMKVDRSESKPMDKPSPYALIIEPTRELCVQVHEQGRKFAHETGVFVTKAYGQYNTRENLRELQAGCDILCATLGRLKHFVNSEQILLKNLKYLVLDEVDVLLDNDFLEDIRSILRFDKFPPKENRQTMLFSATFTPLIQRLASEVLRDDNVMVTNSKLVGSNSKIIQVFEKVSKDDKKSHLYEMLNREIEESETKTLRRTLVFVATKREADLVSLYLIGKGIKSTTINGDRSQDLREKSLRDFRDNQVQVLVSTDVCARGIDIKDLDHVINMDLPTDEVTYVHRIGRTGRLKQGTATSFFDEFDNNDTALAKKLVQIVRDVHQTPPDFLVENAEDGYTFVNQFEKMDAFEADTSDDPKLDAPVEVSEGSDATKVETSKEGTLDASKEETQQDVLQGTDASKEETLDASKEEALDASKEETSKNKALDASKEETQQDVLQGTDASKDKALDASKEVALDASKEEALDTSKEEALDASKDKALNASKEEAFEVSKEEALDASKEEALDASKEEASKDKALDASKEETLDVPKVDTTVEVLEESNATKVETSKDEALQAPNVETEEIC